MPAQAAAKFNDLRPKFPAKSIKPTKVSNAATANNTRRNQTPDAAETAVLAAVGIKPEEFGDTLASYDSSTGHRNRSNR